MDLEHQEAARQERVAGVGHDLSRLAGAEDVELAVREQRELEIRAESPLAQVLQSVLAAKLAASGLRPRVVDRGRREVDPDATVAQPGQPRSVEPGPAGEVENAARRGVEQLAVDPLDLAIDGGGTPTRQDADSPGRAPATGVPAASGG
jgi:hypothetical protein